MLIYVAEGIAKGLLNAIEDMKNLDHSKGSPYQNQFKGV
jgi:hypothetical protein